MTDEKNTKLNEFHKVGELSYFPACRELRDGNGNVVHIRKQSADVLSLLVEFSGELVSKDFIIEKVWEGIVTTDDSLVQCIADIRRAVGKEVIQTFPKKGYKLTSSKHIHQQMTPVATQHYWPNVIAGCIALLALFILARELAGPGLLRSDTPVSDSLNSTGLSSQLPNDQSEHFQSVGSNKPVNPPPVSASETLAVLPFANLSGGSKNQFFSDGLSEDLATDLSKVPGLTVISFASSRGYPDADSGFANIAAEDRKSVV